MAKAKILIVDDSKEMVNTLTEILSAHGYAAVGVACGADALTVVEVEKPDLILLDIAMPGLDGFKTGQKLKQTDATNNIPIIMLSAHCTHEDYLRAVKEVNAVDFVPKPFRMEFLIKKIENALKVSSSQPDDADPKP